MSCKSLERKEAIEEAPKRVEFTERCKECRRFPLRAYNQRPPRPVQTGGGRSETPSSTQLVSLGRLLLFG